MQQSVEMSEVEQATVHGYLMLDSASTVCSYFIETVWFKILLRSNNNMLASRENVDWIILDLIY